jgi:hypothetical protein
LYRSLLSDARFHTLLLAFDRDLADAARSAGCARCSGVLPFRPLLAQATRPCLRLGREHDQRFSFCCAVDGYRSRATPPSLRFHGLFERGEIGPELFRAACWMRLEGVVSKHRERPY